MHKSLIQSLESRYARFDSESKHRSTEVTQEHALHSAGIPEANERLRKACTHLYMANNICPLYLYLKERGVTKLSANSSGDMSWNAVKEREMLEEQQKFISSLETRLKFESARFVDTVVESLGLFDVLDELEAAGGPSALVGYEKGKILKQKFSKFNATMEAWTSHQGEWRITIE